MRGNRLLRSLDRYIGIPLCFILGLIDRIFHQRSVLSAQPSTILVIKLSAIGDTILLSPSLRALRRAYPEARIDMVVTPINREVIEGCPYIDEIVLFDIEECLKNPFEFVKFIRRLRKGNFDLALDFDQWLRISPLIAYLSGARVRIGFKTDRQYRNYLYTTAVRHTRGRHEVECFLEIIRSLGIAIEDKSLEFWARDDQFVQDLFLENGLKEEDLLIALHPGCGSHGRPREWSKENYAYLADILIDQYGAKILLTGSRNEIRLVQEVSRLMKNRPVVLAGKMSLDRLASLLARCSLLISGNNGVMHLAAALGVIVIALHGPTDPSKWGPWKEGHIVIRKHLPCSPCLYLGFEYGCKKHTCMDLISVEDVLKAVRQKLKTQTDKFF